MGKSIETISGEAMDALVSHHWPGNVRELENVIERAVALEQTPICWPIACPCTCAARMARRRLRRGRAWPTTTSLPEAGFDLEQHVQGVERRYLAQALDRAGGVQVRAAELLGMSFRSFRYCAKKYI